MNDNEMITAKMHEVMRILRKDTTPTMMATTLAMCVAEFFEITDATDDMKQSFAKIVNLFEEANNRPAE